ncbi:outer membrane protein [Candidatus Zixiibacteriota bacterium]
MRRALFVTLASAIICLLLAGAASAGIAFAGIGGRVGYVKPEDPIEGTFGVGVVANLGTIVPALRLEGSVDYWAKSYNAAFMAHDAEWKYSDIIIGATAKYMIPTQGSVTPFVGGGLGVHVFNWEYSYDYEWDDPYGYLDEECSDSCSDSKTEVGFHGVGGVEAKLSPNVTGGVEVRYAVSEVNHLGVFGTITYNLIP